jgi:hypothetical protein
MAAIMENTHLINSMMEKRAELLREHDAHQAAIRRINVDLEALDATLRLFGAGKPVHKAILPSYRREVARIVLSVLRDSAVSMTAQSLAKHVLIERKVNPDDMNLIQAVTKRVRGCLQHYRRKGVVVSRENNAGILEWTIMPHAVAAVDYDELGSGGGWDET